MTNVHPKEQSEGVGTSMHIWVSVHAESSSPPDARCSDIAVLAFITAGAVSGNRDRQVRPTCMTNLADRLSPTGNEFLVLQKYHHVEPWRHLVTSVQDTFASIVESAPSQHGSPSHQGQVGMSDLQVS